MFIVGIAGFPNLTADRTVRVPGPSLSKAATKCSRALPRSALACFRKRQYCWNFLRRRIYFRAQLLKLASQVLRHLRIHFFEHPLCRVSHSGGMSSVGFCLLKCDRNFLLERRVELGV